MWQKLIFGLVLAVIGGQQFVNGLTCYSCNSPASCVSPSPQVCSDATAHETTVWLNTIHKFVPVVGSSNSFSCMNLTYYFENNRSKIHEYLGCHHPDIPVCILPLNASNSDSWKKGCLSCEADKCNRNPAATSSQSLYSIMITAMALIVAKFAF
ncbi:uncharacterized protein LOC111593775 [Drosophila hydei]|uniref:Uncharacterized protein LOC111593775 n=1 Tax=Drosophila hydei TaxID=7224 RepID=A0A6J1LDS9_DROHY|nr:uncharacterized protein LOC111593775 [Drosophila hydei]